jgi:murein L,D-transpeptidase YcbB/YkuD
MNMLATKTRAARLALVALALLAATPACREASSIGKPWSPVEPSRELIESMRHDVDELVRARIEDEVTADALRDHVAKQAKDPWNTRVRSGIKYADLFAEIYAARDHRKIAARYDGLAPRGKAILAALEGYARHDISEPMDYHIEAITKLDAQLSEQSARDAWTPGPLLPAEIEALVEWAAERGYTERTPAMEDELVALVLGRGESGADPSPRLRAASQTFAEAVRPHALRAAELELLTVDGALRYARDMKHFNLSRLSWRDLKKAGGSKKLIYGRLRGFYEELAATPHDRVGPLFTGLEPSHPQYAKLLAARERYLAIVEAGGWKDTARVSLRRGASGARVEALRKRLAAEGYLADPSGDRVDDALLEAVATYRRTHQLALDGPPPASFWRSLDVPASRRLAQIELSLERWRESRYEGEEDFVFVNLPDFHAELYEARQRTMRFRVVIGKNNRVCDPKTATWAYPNATPELMSTLEYFILNPSWNVPERIVEEEIVPKMEADEEYLAKNNYEIVSQRTTDEGVEKYKIRQLPGEDNALGKVKFIFPNRHNTYMHDTPHKKYFDYTIRDYSHGCMRVHDPLAFARHLVSSDGQSESIDVDAILSSGRSKMVEMKRELPVFVEYYTVRVDDDGMPNFLIDIYHKDRLAMSRNPRALQRCTPAPQPDAEDAGDGRPDTSRDVGP